MKNLTQIEMEENNRNLKEYKKNMSMIDIETMIDIEMNSYIPFCISHLSSSNPPGQNPKHIVKYILDKLEYDYYYNGYGFYTGWTGWYLLP